MDRMDTDANPPQRKRILRKHKINESFISFIKPGLFILAFIKQRA